MKYYVDTCIWRDFHENRSDRFRPLGEWAFQFFRMIKKTRSKVLYSSLILKELSIVFDKKTILEILSIVNDENLLEKVKINREQYGEAARLNRDRKLPFVDLLHAILARDNNAILVTRDKHFQQFDDIEIRKPEDLI